MATTIQCEECGERVSLDTMSDDSGVVLCPRCQGVWEKEIGKEIKLEENDEQNRVESKDE